MAKRGRPPGPESTSSVAFRAPNSLIDRIDKEAARIAPQGITIPRTSLIVLLLKEALDAREAKAAADPAAPPGRPAVRSPGLPVQKKRAAP